MEDHSKSYPLVSIISINFNQLEVSRDMLLTLQKLTYPRVEIILVDNNSSHGNVDELKQEFPEIILIKSPQNLGFAGGNNLAVRRAKGEFLMFLNNDTEVPPGFLEPLVAVLKNDKTIGMVSPKIKFHWNPKILQYAGITKMNPFTIRNHGLGYHKTDGPEFDRLSQTESIHGAAMMVPRRVIEEVGMMAEVYFLYYEEHDWAEIVKRAGYKIYYQPASYILHKESVSTGKNSPFQTYYINRNRLMFARRNFKGFPFFVSVVFQTFVSIPKNTLKYLLSGKIKHLQAYWKAILWNLMNYKIIRGNPKL